MNESISSELESIPENSDSLTCTTHQKVGQNSGFVGIISSISGNTNCVRWEMGDRIQSEDSFAYGDIATLQSDILDEQREPSEIGYRKHLFEETRTLSTTCTGTTGSSDWSRSSNNTYHLQRKSDSGRKAAVTSNSPCSSHENMLMCGTLSGIARSNTVYTTPSIIHENDREQEESLAMGIEPEAVHRSEFLYSLSKEKQVEGRRRREAIALVSYERNRIPTVEDFGTIPLSRACDIYYRGMRVIQDRNMWVTERQREKLRHEDQNHYFKLAKGAFAYCPDPKLQTSTNILHSEFPGPRNMKLPLSRAHDMYDKSLKIIHAKNEWIAAFHANVASRQKTWKKIPLSRANDMYEKSLRVIHAKNLRISHCVNEGQSYARKTIPLSRAAEMYEKSIKYIHRKYQRLSEVRRVQKKEENNEASVPRNCLIIPVSKVGQLHYRGIKCQKGNKALAQGLESTQKEMTKIRKQKKKRKSKSPVGKTIESTKEKNKSEDDDNDDESAKNVRNLTTMTTASSGTSLGTIISRRCSNEDDYTLRPRYSMTSDEQSFISRANDLYETSLKLIHNRFYEEDERIELQVLDEPSLISSSNNHFGV
uniref:Uncharacterized protein n=1 Tax=Chaetoceros debilis TaxID=122233 RepID=A0A7S3QCC7_9STRA